MAGSIYITTPDPGATPASIAAAVNALKHNVNLIIINAQENPPLTALAGATAFSKINQLSIEISNLQSQITNLQAQINALRALIP